MDNVCPILAYLILVNELFSGNKTSEMMSVPNLIIYPCSCYSRFNVRSTSMAIFFAVAKRSGPISSMRSRVSRYAGPAIEIEAIGRLHMGATIALIPSSNSSTEIAIPRSRTWRRSSKKISGDVSVFCVYPGIPRSRICLIFSSGKNARIALPEGSISLRKKNWNPLNQQKGLKSLPHPDLITDGIYSAINMPPLF